MEISVKKCANSRHFVIVIGISCPQNKWFTVLYLANRSYMITMNIGQIGLYLI